MEGHVWAIVLSLLPDSQAKRGDTYSDRVILMIALWAVLHDRPRCWACDAQNWPAALRPERLPHPGTLSRRLRRPELQEVTDAVHAQAVQRLGVTGRLGAMDGRPLTVGGASKDPDARPGRAVGGMGRGYKLHGVADGAGVLHRFQVESLPVDEKRVARHLLTQLPEAITRVVADGNYDSVGLHRVAHE